MCSDFSSKPIIIQLLSASSQQTTKTIMSSSTTSQHNLKIPTVPFEDGEVERVDLDSISTSSNAPAMVESDMDNGLETVSCQLASKFYERYGASLHGITKRGALSQFYIDTYDSWCPEDLAGQPRHFKQVLYALANDTKMVRVVGGGRFLRWTEFQYRGGDRRQTGRRNYNSSRQGGGSRARSNSRGYDSQDQDGFQTQQRRNRGGRSNYDRVQPRSNHYGPITDDLIDRIADRLSKRDNSDRR
jgi:hypothetical protein